MNVENKTLSQPPIHYYVSGNVNKELLVLIHPAFADHRAFEHQIKFFSDKFRIITIDLIGHGLSQGFKTNDKIDCSARQLNEIMKIEKYEKVNLIGVSIGSLIAQDFANKYPNKVSSLCALGGYDINNYDKSAEKSQAAQQISFMFKALISIKWFSKANSLISASTQSARDEFYQMNLLFKRSSFKYMTTLSNIINKYKDIKRNYPLFIMCGELDSSLAIELSKKWCNSDKNSHFKIVENAGHCANMDNPEKFNDLLNEFYKENNII